MPYNNVFVSRVFEKILFFLLGRKEGRKEGREKERKISEIPTVKFFIAVKLKEAHLSWPYGSKDRSMIKTKHIDT